MKTDITIILDRSGSMESVKSDTIGGFNSFLADQQKEDSPATLSLVQFDHEYETVYENLNIKDVQKLTEATFQPRGRTALRDAIGRTINSVGQRLSDTLEIDRPDNVLIVILTDGFENASREFNVQQIGEMVQHQQDVYNWQFLFIGANQDAILSAQAMNIPQTNAMSYAANAVGTQAVFDSVALNVQAYRQTGLRGAVAFKDSDRKKQYDAGATKDRFAEKLRK